MYQPQPSQLSSPTKLQQSQKLVQPTSKFNECREKVNTLLLSAPYELFMTLVTFIVLYIDDVRMLVFTKFDDDIYYDFMLSTFFLFLVEICVLSIVRPGYLNSFFFWMDLASTFSTILEIPMVTVGVFGIQGLSGGQSAKLAKAGRASRVSSRATKVIRVIRLVRLVRIAKLYKYAYKNIEAQLAAQLREKGDDIYEEKVQVKKRRRRQKQDDDNEANVIIEQFNPKMIPKPNAINLKDGQMNESPLVDQQPQNLNEIERMVDGNHTQTYQSQAQYMIEMPNPMTSTINKPYTKIQMLEIGEKPIHYEQHESFESLNEEPIQKTKIQVQDEEEKLLDLGGTTQLQETDVGKTLSDLTTKRAIMVMFAIMISIPLLDPDTFFTQVTAFDAGVNELENEYYFGYNTQALLNGSVSVLKSTIEINSYKLVGLLIVDVQIFNDTLVDSLRTEELKQYYSDSGSSMLIMAAKSESDMNSILGIIRTSFVIVVMVAGAVLFSKDASDLVVNPIESMLAKVKRISDNPLAAAKIEEDIAVAEEQLKNEKIDLKEQKKRQAVQMYETVILEKLIVKTGALLAIGFGDAGANIVAQNIKQGGEVNPLIAGKKQFAIFGFCDIRNFVDFTEVLEEKVMVFVNEVALIVHSTVAHFEGATNKNIGDAFLLVWKFPEEYIRLNNDNPEILDNRMVNNYADMALLSFIRIFLMVRKSKNLKVYCENPDVQARLPGFQMKMGYGLHVGWAIEGAIGSMFKIDASYLSPNVNMASRLEAATKQYGVFHLVSGPFYRLLSGIAQSKMRHIDRVTVKGSIQPVDFFTYDIDLKEIKGEYISLDRNRNVKIQNFMERRRRHQRMQKMKDDKLNMYNVFEADPELQDLQKKFTYDFKSSFNDGINSYLQGRWQYAKKCFEYTLQEFGDGPSKTLLNFMEQFDFDAPEEWRGFRELVDK